MDNTGDAEYQLYWETKLFLQTQELQSLSTYYDSSSPDGIASPLESKNIVSERNRRKKLNDRLIALRAIVPNISKMDKASIIKDAISYIQELRKQQRIIKAEISYMEYYRSKNNCGSSPCSADFDDHDMPSVFAKPNKKKRVDHGRKQYFGSNGCCISSTIDDLEMRVSYVGERTMVVSLTCSKREGTLVKLCQLFELLKLKIITAHITALSGKLLKTVFVEADEREKDHLEIEIETVMASARV